MPLITNAEIAQMQADIIATDFDTAFTVKRKTRTPDGTGHYSESITTIVSSVNGNLSQPSANQMQNYGYRIGSLAAWQVRLPVGTNVLENDLLLTSGQTLTVQVIMQPKSRQTNLHLLASEVE